MVLVLGDTSTRSGSGLNALGFSVGGSLVSTIYTMVRYILRLRNMALSQDCNLVRLVCHKYVQNTYIFQFVTYDLILMQDVSKRRGLYEGMCPPRRRPPTSSFRMDPKDVFFLGFCSA